MKQDDKENYTVSEGGSVLVNIANVKWESIKHDQATGEVTIEVYFLSDGVKPSLRCKLGAGGDLFFAPLTEEAVEDYRKKTAHCEQGKGGSE